MKRLLIFTLLVVSSTAVFAQKRKVLNLSTYDNRKFHFGFSLGVNTIDYRLSFWDAMGDNPNFTQDPRWANDAVQVGPTDTLRADLASLRPGFTVSIVTDLRLGKYFNLRFLPGLSFGERRLIYSKNHEYLPIYNIYTGTQDNEFIRVNSTFLDLPLLVKYKSSRLNNIRPYIVAGFAYRIDVARTGEEDLLSFKGGSTYMEFGVGLENYLPFFKFSTELKFSLGLNNILAEAPSDQRAYYAQAIKGINSNVVTLSFHFE